MELREEDITENVIFIKVNHYYKEGMSEQALYDLTRRAWKMSIDRANLADYVFSVYESIILEVYKIAAWLPAHSTYNSLPVSDMDKENDIKGNRIEFVGQIAEDKIRDKYVGKSVAGFYKKGEQNPIKYINI